jgi:Tfp pilus assembly PilM family ATPase
MKRGHPSPYVLGVEFGPHSVRLVEVECLRKGYRLQQCCEGFYPENIRFRGVFDAQITKTFLRILRSLLTKCQPKSRKVNIGMDSRSLLLRRVAVDSWLEGDDLRDQVLWEAQQLLIDPLDCYVVDYHVQDIDESTREVLLVMVRRETAEGYLDIAHQTGLEPLCLDVDLIALGNAYEYFTGRRLNGPTAVLDIEQDCVRCVIVSGNVFWFGQTAEITAQPSDLEKLIVRAAAYGGRTGSSPPFSEIVVCGSETAAEKIGCDLSRFSPSIRVAFPFQKMKLGPSISRQQIQKHAPAYMVCIGLALRGVTEL